MPKSLQVPRLCVPLRTLRLNKNLIKISNARVTFADINTDGEIDQQREILQEAHYYPFGLQHYGPYKPTRGDDNNYTYNGKETVHGLDLNWLDYGARWYDPAVARWWAVDPLAEKYAGWSGYNYVIGNPIILIDPDGMEVDDVIVNGAGADKLVAALNEATGLKISRDAETGKLSAAGEATTDAEKKLKEAIDSPTNHVKVDATDATSYDDPSDESKNNPLLPGGYLGSEVSEKDGKKETTGHQKVNMDVLGKVAGVVGEKPGETVMHEINEAYLGTQLDPGGSYATGYEKSHNAAKKLDRVDAGGVQINRVSGKDATGASTFTYQMRMKSTEPWVTLSTTKQ